MSQSSTAPRYLNRADAAAWLRDRGITHVTSGHLADLANSGRGPPYSRMGRYTYYAQTDLEAWLAQALKPTQRARGAVAGGRR